MIDPEADHAGLIQELEQKVSWCHANGMKHLSNALKKAQLALKGLSYETVEADAEVADKPKIIGDDGTGVRADPAGTSANETNGAAEGDEFPKAHDAKVDNAKEAERAEAKDKTPIVTVVPPGETHVTDPETGGTTYA